MEENIIYSSRILVPSGQCKANNFVKTRMRFRIQDMIFNIGGLSNLIWFISLLPGNDVFKQRLAIKLLYTMLLHNTKNVKELELISGYELLSRIIRRHNWHLDTTLLSLLFRFSGIKKSITKIREENNTNSSSSTNPNLDSEKDSRIYEEDISFSGVISNVSAFKYLILDRGLWKRANVEVQELMFSVIANLVTKSNHDFAAFNISRLKNLKF